jgi:hypothetical protein
MLYGKKIAGSWKDFSKINLISIFNATDRPFHHISLNYIIRKSTHVKIGSIWWSNSPTKD